MQTQVVATLALGGALALALGGAVGCGNDANDNSDDPADYDCSIEMRDDDFVAGITRTGPDGTNFRIMSAMPAVPTGGDNSWVLEVTDSNNAPMVGALVDVTPFMPDHQHGTPIAVEVTEGTTAGEYDAAPVNLWMPGLWEITIEAIPAGGTVTDRDAAVFRFCIEP